MKKFLATILSIILVISIVPTGAITASAATGNTAEFAGGSGTKKDPYLIATTYHLDNVRYYLDAHFLQIADIVFDDEDFQLDGDFYNDSDGWEPIGTENTPFTMKD